MKNKLVVTDEMFFDQVRTYISDPDSLAMIRKAYEYAREKHKEQFRKSGEPYFVHLQNVGYILATLHAGPQTISAGLLHDTMEDCNVPKEEIAREFDMDVANLVEGVTKIGRLAFNDDKEYEAANHRKIFIAMAKDVRVIIIKLVDRLHNMRTLEYTSKESQVRKASETLQVYCPIAHRLGFGDIKNELEDLCFYYLDPVHYHEVASLVEAKKRERQRMVDKMINEIADMLKEHNFKFRIFGRSKHLYSIYKKMTTKNKRFDEIFDLYAIRVVTQTELNCYEILGYIHAKYRPMPGRLKDYIAMPKVNMYQSIHTTILDADGNIFEVQIRTEEMDSIAEQGIAAHWSYKEGRLYNSEKEQKEIENKLSWYHDMIAMMDESELEHPSEMLNTIQKDIFEANIYVMSPKGRVIELPNGATPLDFAYRIHTEVGHNAIGSIVNGALVPLNTQLKTGDIVQIRTSKQATGPSEDWLKIVKTSHAKNKIKNYLIKVEEEKRKEIIAKGEKILSDEIKKRNLEEKAAFDKASIEKVAGMFNLSSYNDLLYAIGMKSVSMVQVMEKLTNQKRSALEGFDISRLFRGNRRTRPAGRTGLQVEGVDNMKISIAGCCMPVYGDEIVGYITKGQGVKVHRRDCPNIRGQQSRLINVRWEEDDTTKQYDCWLKIDASDRSYLISDIVTVVAQYKAGLMGINSEVLPDKVNVTVDLKVRVNNSDQLHLLMTNIRKIDSVVGVERIIK
ncbi:MAG: bifunctional (p)ppGpp synthetase/guanosine-3',5'-bis(diphosphate) 3'-pyrophosphohydrolase [Erysipelotrichaceae bacterium]|nr:bifunctional (p)ppGpp synthetase/guanosine-3',5'-bis(diphosphate) 3'-pyrophosphohydrolase [Erysipelotrichaceae bacterium]MBR2545526.1 bifunctional (p)ppGpp synthetase/guanosine-3',5'-bis(diphosphate) 3'-pyrophosphohydrolase [Erysipelotrichaceae bacterium]MBR2700635.1 bifunctional (p)ppGpp synthetase/guanosine-3',5'-bis(diphosphate) 3'-pyrophosphohydrolase [Erysipelotrichaceae bacterium]MBR2745424.1 bifunctional (p)ppGpp synthetase/guanosine-3',5'-bis(diphosphate) 3'-pyrophosphohydrolase [Erys